MNKWLRLSVLFTAFLCLTSITFGQKDKEKYKDKGHLACRDNWSDDRLVAHCEIKEETIPARGGPIDVDARKNGGISINGWDRGEILVRARIQTAATSQAEADELAKQITIETSGQISANGPAMHNDYHWDVSYEIFVPRRSDLSLKTYNGGIAVADVNGRIEFSATNGGVVLKRIGGSVHGGTTNGGLHVELAGDRWDGEELDVKTTNGGIDMSMPENYSAHLETSTVNGNLSIDFPVTVQGKITRELAVNLGSGGPTIRAMTTNGGLRIKRAAL
jgi:DUF4097 and DUF4098 domain-containing protein YvlB